jgi:hypothetical protein
MNLSQFGFRSRHCTGLQCMKRTEHGFVNFNNQKAAVFWVLKRNLIRVSAPTRLGQEEICG